MVQEWDTFHGLGFPRSPCFSTRRAGMFLTAGLGTCSHPKPITV